MINCLYSYLLPALQDLLSPTIKDISWFHITEGLVVTVVVVVVDEVGNCSEEVLPCIQDKNLFE